MTAGHHKHHRSTESEATSLVVTAVPRLRNSISIDLILRLPSKTCSLRRTFYRGRSGIFQTYTRKQPRTTHLLRLKTLSLQDAPNLVDIVGDVYEQNTEEGHTRSGRFLTSWCALASTQCPSSSRREESRVAVRTYSRRSCRPSISPPTRGSSRTYLGSAPVQCSTAGLASRLAFLLLSTPDRITRSVST